MRLRDYSALLLYRKPLQAYQMTTVLGQLQEHQYQLPKAEPVKNIPELFPPKIGLYNSSALTTQEPPHQPSYPRRPSRR